MSAPQNFSLGVPATNSPPSLNMKSLGSATGNPRNKCVLKPGHSLMDWIRLGNSGYDLSGTNGAIIPVSPNELSKHCTRDDAWIAIRGKVFNVTKYMDFHPGGPDELMLGVGKDATKEFDKVHAWVNYEQLLRKCFIGPLHNVVKMDVDIFKTANGDRSPPKKPITPTPKPMPIEIIPRFDWIQKRSEISLHFYTKQFCNPGYILKRKSDTSIVVTICIENSFHVYDFELASPVAWPPNSTKVSSETGKIEINLTKVDANLWPSIGSNNTSKVQQIEDHQYAFEILEKQSFNHNSFSSVLRAKNDVIIHLPVGYHQTFSCLISGEKVDRSYTAVPKEYTTFTDGSPNDLYFLFKTYSDGLYSKYLDGLQIGAELECSQPKGNIRLNKLLGHTRIALLAAGSGITPMLGLIDHLLVRNTNKLDNLVLMFFNTTEEDIWCRQPLEELSKSDDRFRIVHILSQPSDKWSGEKGRITTDLMSPIKDQSSPNYSTFVCVCGPPTFNSLAETILKSLDYTEATMHIF